MFQGRQLFLFYLFYKLLVHKSLILALQLILPCMACWWQQSRWRSTLTLRIPPPASQSAKLKHCAECVLSEALALLWMIESAAQKLQA